MINPILKPGDIFLTYNYSVGAKIVMGLMQSPTIYQQIWRYFNKTLEPVYFYHAGMVLSDTQMIEQQGVVKYNPVSKIFKKDYVIFRRKNLSRTEQIRLAVTAELDLGEGYGILECFGKFITWITGIKYFSKWFDMKDRAICVVRVAEWYRDAGVDEDFGKRNPNYITTKLMYSYCKNSDNWETVAEFIKED